MAALTVAACQRVSVVDQITGPASEEITAGQTVMVDVASNGHITPHNGTTLGIIGVALTSALAGMEVTAVIRGLVDLGDALDAIAFNAVIFAGAAGTVDGAAGVPIGFVWPGYGSVGVDKILWLTGIGGGA